MCRSRTLGCHEVLLVEDDPSMQTALKRTLTAAAWTCALCGDGALGAGALAGRSPTS
jgi:DNA-binding response OmpR family regulator